MRIKIKNSLVHKGLITDVSGQGGTYLAKLLGVNIQKSPQHIITSGEDVAIAEKMLNGTYITRSRSSLEVVSMPVAP